MNKQQTANTRQQKELHNIKEQIRDLLGTQDRNTIRSGLIRGASGTFALKVVSTVLAFTTSLVLARLLGVKEYGAYAYAISWVLLLSVPAVMGLDVLLTREVVRYKTQADWGSLHGILCWSDRVVFFVSIGLALLAGFVVWGFAGRLEQQISTTIWVALIILPFLAFIRLRQGGIQGLGRVVEAQLPQLLILPALFLVLSLLLNFIYGNLSASKTVGIYAFAAGVACLVGTVLLKKYLPSSIKRSTPNYHSRMWFCNTLPLLIVGMTGILNEQISVVMVGSMVGSEAAGIYDVARRGAALVSFVLMAVNMPLAPVIASLYARGEMERLQRVVTKSARISLIGSLPLSLGLIIFGRWFLLLFGREFSEGSLPLAILSLGQLVNAGMGSVALLLNMTGYERDTAKGIGVAAVVNVVLNAALIQAWGVEGAAVASTISMAIWNILLAIWVYKRLGINSTAFATGGIERKS